MKMTEKEMLDVEQLRMGGSYLQEMKQLRAEGADIERIEKYFLQKDLQTELDERRRTEREIRMKEKTEELKKIKLIREMRKKPWGVEMGHFWRYSKSC